jgi:DNA-binding response OmpR family regulator
MARILIVDDEEIARISLAEILRLEGYEIRTASGGQAAVVALNSEPIDVMILDLKMPGMSGIDVLKAIVDTLPRLRVIVLTAHGSMDTAIQALRFRVHDYLLKPILPGQIIESIESAVVSLNSIGDELTEDPERPKRYYQLAAGIEMDTNKRLITWQDQSISLTPTESRLMIILTEAAGQMITHADIVFHCHGYRVNNEEAAKILRPVVSRLRQKMSSVPGWNEWIKNIRGAGYVLDLPDSTIA